MLAACGDDEREPDDVRRTGPDEVPVAQVVLPSFQFVDGTRSLGLDFTHTSGADGRKLLPETMGPGCALFDADLDGDLDLFITNGRAWEGDAVTTGRFFRMEEGRFVDRTAEVGLDGEAFCLIGQGVSSADYDGDGDWDLYLTNLGPNILLRNDGASFTDVTAEAGVAGSNWTDEAGGTHPEWSTSSTFVDLDADGWLDLVVCNYLEWALENDVPFVLEGDVPGYASPKLYKGATTRVFRNLGDGTFADVTESSGALSQDHKALGVNVADVDRDGRIDVVVANDTQPNVLFLNRTEAPGEIRLEDVGAQSGVGYGGNGMVRAGMGLDVAFYYADEGKAPDLAIAVGNFSAEPISFFRSRRLDRVLFSDDNRVAGLGVSSGPSLTFAMAFVDPNLDGYPDLLAINGHLEPDIALISDSTSFRQRPQLFHNQGRRGRFEDASDHAGPAFERAIVGRGLALGDLDGDLDVDAVVVECGGPAHVWLDETELEGRKPLRIALEMDGPNRYAIGAEVTVTGGPFPQTRWVRTGSSYLSQHESALTFGVGDAASADVSVRWPDGRTSEHAGLQPGAMHVLRPN